MMDTKHNVTTKKRMKRRHGSGAAIMALLSLTSTINTASIEARIGSAAAGRVARDVGTSDHTSTSSATRSVSPSFARRYPLLSAEMERRRKQEQLMSSSASSESDSMALSFRLQQHHRHGDQQKEDGTENSPSSYALADEESFRQDEQYYLLHSQQYERQQQRRRSLSSSESSPLISLTLDTTTSSDSTSTTTSATGASITDATAQKSSNGQAVEVRFAIEKPVTRTTTSGGTATTSGDVESTCFLLQMNLVGLATGRADGLIISVLDDEEAEAERTQQDGVKVKKPPAVLHSPIEEDTRLIALDYSGD
mmetsp:Transcript_33188/g.71811  ORF Transcript_33188/g.71811 Transcript_33188/m.71811 type:complete len:309 (-) Transcript_33188:233-1159(-)